MFYVPFSLVVDVVNLYGLYEPYREHRQNRPITYYPRHLR
jgi:hypothetical protein